MVNGPDSDASAEAVIDVAVDEQGRKAGEPDFSKATLEALAAFRYLLRRFLRDSEERARRLRITPQQYQLLLAIQGQHERDWARISELADALQIQHHAAVGLVSRSERAKLLIRVRDETDKRQLRVVLTQKGIDVVSQIARPNFAELKDLLLSLELLFQRGSMTMEEAAAIVNVVTLDRSDAESFARRSIDGKPMPVAA